MAIVLGAARAAFKVALPSFITRGFSTNRAIKEAIGLGIGFRRKDMLNMFRTGADLEKKKDAAKYIRKDYLPDASSYFVTDSAMKHNYLGKVHYNVYDGDGNFVRDSFVCILDNEPMRPGEVEKRAKELMVTDKYMIEGEYKDDFMFTVPMAGPGVL